jgi:hypothetical protein
MSAATVLADIAPQFDALDSDLKTRTLERAAAQCSQTVYADQYYEAVANLAAHMLTLRANASTQSGSNVKRKKSRNVEVEYFQSSDPYMSTTYGMEFCRIRDSVSFGLDNTGL